MLITSFDSKTISKLNCEWHFIIKSFEVLIRLIWFLEIIYQFIGNSLFYQFCKGESVTRCHSKDQDYQSSQKLKKYF